MFQCYLEPNCVSYNFCEIKHSSGKHKCDLNNATIEHDEDLVEYKRFYLPRSRGEYEFYGLRVIFLVRESFDTALGDTPASLLRTSLCKNQTWEIKIFNPPSNFACS